MPKMKNKTNNYLLILTAILWLAPWIGKQHLPQIFAVDYIQWIFAILLAILIPFGSILTISSMLRDIKERRSGYFTLLGFSIIFVVNLSSIVITQSTVSRLHIPFYNDDSFTIQQFIEFSQKLESAEKRKSAAQYLYQSYGIQAAFIDEDKTLKLYTPSKSDIDSWRERKLQNNKISSMQKQIYLVLKQMSWLFVMHMAMYAIIMSLGLAILLFGKSGKDFILSKPLDKISPGI